MSGHTPGPWNNAVAADGTRVTCQRYDIPTPPELASEEWQANLRLVDAAPDMLALLKELIGVGDPPDDRHWADRVLEVITKAEGAT